MGFVNMKGFEFLNNVQVNVFGYEKGELQRPLVSNYDSLFVMDIFLLYECDWCHYVLITYLRNVVCYMRDIMFVYCN